MRIVCPRKWDADGRAAAAGRRCRRGVPAAVIAVAAVQLRLGVEHVRLPEEGCHGTVEVAAVIGGLNGLPQLILLGVGHGVAHIVAAVDLPVAVLHQQQYHVVASQPPLLAQVGGVILRVPAGQMVDAGHRRNGVILAVPAVVVVPDQLLRLSVQQTGLVTDPVLVLHVQQLCGLLGDKAVLAALADEHRASNGQHQHHQCHAAFFKKLHTCSPFRRRLILFSAPQLHELLLQLTLDLTQRPILRCVQNGGPG